MDFTPVATGYCFLEAPRADRRGAWFSDIMLGGIHCARPDGRIDKFFPDKKWIGGIAFNEDGAVLCSGEGGISWVNPETGATGVLLDKIDGVPISGVNDIQPDEKGGLYFGTSDLDALQRREPPKPVALYRLDADGRVTKLSDGLRFSNGIGLSPDGKRLYHCETFVGVFVHDLRPDGSLGARTLFAAEQNCDGLAVDAEGGVWVADFDAGAVTRLRPDGTVDRRVRAPTGGAVSICFGGDDWRDVYLATIADGAVEAIVKGAAPPLTATLYRARSPIPGRPVGRTRFKLATRS